VQPCAPASIRELALSFVVWPTPAMLDAVQRPSET
jgi:hypothetical protein